MKIKYTKEFLEPFIKSSTSFSEVLRNINPNVKIHGGSIDWLKKKIIEFEIDYSHFLGRAWLKGKKGTVNQISKLELEEKYLISKSTIISNRLKEYLLRFNFKNYQCEICDNRGQWQSKKLTLQLDHINGDREDNRLNNLRIICPNCHSQTHTYSGKKNIRKRDE